MNFETQKILTFSENPSQSFVQNTFISHELGKKYNKFISGENDG